MGEPHKGKEGRIEGEEENVNAEEEKRGKEGSNLIRCYKSGDLSSLMVKLFVN